MIVQGAVQGVGFRPFIYRLANDCGLYGFVQNRTTGVHIEIEGQEASISQFLGRLHSEKPPQSIIYSMEKTMLDPLGYTEFEIKSSDEQGERSSWILPDLATCDECLNDIFDPNNRRYLYPFTNCTNCGPRFSIIEKIPYDRPNTSMKAFDMCPECRGEFTDPGNRRFHAQPNACPVCGPEVLLFDSQKTKLSSENDAILSAAEALEEGQIVALKGIGGFQLLVDASNEEAVARLRRRKQREEKPLALMVPTLELAESLCKVSATERQVLQSPAAPILILEKKAEADSIAHSVAPGNPNLGIMLPYSPLHHILLHYFSKPVVATSANLSDEPICISNEEAFDRLTNIADLFLTHNRAIVRPLDDSVVRVIAGRELVLRRARGYTPLPAVFKRGLPPALAVGGHLKNTVAISKGPCIFVSQHNGDLETVEAMNAFERAINDIWDIYDVRPQTTVCDKHPEYLSGQFAKGYGHPVEKVQHHYAHILACMAENELEPPVLGVSWDGTGYGDDGTVWGGEFLLVDENRYKRFACFRPFRLPGGEAAIKDCRRTALSCLAEFLNADQVFDIAINRLEMQEAEVQSLMQIIEKGINSPLCTSAGRLFDAVSALLGIQDRNKYEGQAPMMLEYAASKSQTSEGLAYRLKNGGENSSWIIDWQPIFEALLGDLDNVRVEDLANKFHNTLADAIVELAKWGGQERIVLSGGTFQNKILTEAAVSKLRKSGFKPYWHQRFPPNDGSLSLGQLAYLYYSNKFQEYEHVSGDTRQNSQHLW